MLSDDMTAIFEETEENLIKLKEIFKELHDFSGLQINEGKTKIKRIGDKLDTFEPLTDKDSFKYTKTFRLIVVGIHNKLK